MRDDYSRRVNLRVVALALVLPLLLAFATGSDTVTGTSRQTSKRAPKHTSKAKHTSGSQLKPPPPPSALTPSSSSFPVQRGLSIWLLTATLVPPLTLGACIALREAGWRWPSSSSRASDNASWAFVGFLIVAYFALNIGLSILNRWALGLYGLKFPVLMTSTHMIFGSWALTPIMVLEDEYMSEHAATLRGQSTGLALVAILNGVQIAANNASLAVMELSMNQVVRAGVPVLTALVGISIEGKVPTALELAALIGVSAGVVVCVYHDSGASSAMGVLLVGISAVVQAAQMSLSSRLMTKKLSPFQMTFYTGPIAFLCLLPWALWYEAETFVRACEQQPMGVVAFLLGGCVMAVMYNVVFFQCLQTISSVGTSIMGNVKIVFLILLSAVTLGELATWPRNQYIGCILTFGCTAWYSYLKQVAAKKRSKIE